MTSTIGFAVADEDRDRLQRLVDHFGAGNRSAYLRATFAVMESLARAQTLQELQADSDERRGSDGVNDEQALIDAVRLAYKGRPRGERRAEP